MTPQPRPFPFIVLSNVTIIRHCDQQILQLITMIVLLSPSYPHGTIIIRMPMPTKHPLLSSVGSSPLTIICKPQDVRKCDKDDTVPVARARHLFAHAHRYAEPDVVRWLLTGSSHTLNSLVSLTDWFPRGIRIRKKRDEYLERNISHRWPLICPLAAS